MNKKNDFNLVYKIKNPKTEKSCAVDRLKMAYSWTSLCQSGRDPEKYFDIGMVRLNQMGIMGSQHFGQSISFKKNSHLQAYPFTI